jgi:F-type H+-transporting ATPase subunit alpha
MFKTFSSYLKETAEVGYIKRIFQSVVYVSGLPTAKPGEIVVFEEGGIGRIETLKEDFIEVLPFTKAPLRLGMRVARTGKYLEIPVGEALLGRVIDPLGHKITSFLTDGRMTSTRQVFVPSPGIGKRARVRKPLYTGVAAVDLLVPLGRGQRELVLGDPNTGKTTFLFQTILAQARLGTVCIYAAVGKKKLAIKRAEEFFVESGIKDKVIIIASYAEDPPAQIFITPFSAMTVAEYFRDLGRDVLLVIDDMITHAKVYREFSLLAGRFPGRESYPGDIFWIHAQLLERAGNFISENGEASITCLPVVGTTGNSFGYIQTNLISITDGHIFFDADLFVKGVRPAINPFLSVTRVGYQTHSLLIQEMSRKLVSFLSNYERVQSFVRFGAELSENIKETLNLGERLHIFFQQYLGEIREIEIQAVLVAMLWNKIWEVKTLEETKKEIDAIIYTYHSNKKYNKLVNDLVSDASSWDNFLQKVQEKTQDLLLPILKDRGNGYYKNTN